MTNITWDSATSSGVTISNNDQDLTAGAAYGYAKSDQSWSAPLNGNVVFSFPSYSSGVVFFGLGTDPLHSGGTAYADIEIRMMIDQSGGIGYVKDGSDNSNLTTFSISSGVQCKIEIAGNNTVTYHYKNLGDSTWTQAYSHTVSQSGTWYVHGVPYNATVSADLTDNSGGGSSGGSSGDSTATAMYEPPIQIFRRMNF